MMLCEATLVTSVTDSENVDHRCVDEVELHVTRIKKKKKKNPYIRLPHALSAS